MESKADIYKVNIWGLYSRLLCVSVVIKT
jgi:hypothetical protein